jgi:hypothetical protein
MPIRPRDDRGRPAATRTRQEAAAAPFMSPRCSLAQTDSKSRRTIAPPDRKTAPQPLSCARTNLKGPRRVVGAQHVLMHGGVLAATDAVRHRFRTHETGVICEALARVRQASASGQHAATHHGRGTYPRDNDCTSRTRGRRRLCCSPNSRLAAPIRNRRRAVVQSSPTRSSGTGRYEGWMRSSGWTRVCDGGTPESRAGGCWGSDSP